MSRMKTTSDEVQEAVTSYMVAQRLSQRGLAKLLGWHPRTLNARLTGTRRWSIDDLSSLQKAGVLSVEITPAVGDVSC
ncbi:helix-turn-helix transcriptional regulator [Arcanobacterium haemolyticum]|nr:helix-turn-helix transcriptional regulator [Arcanobacterium haemolyticum]